LNSIKNGEKHFKNYRTYRRRGNSVGDEIAELKQNGESAEEKIEKNAGS